jgi:hypothetical protein
VADEQHGGKSAGREAGEGDDPARGGAPPGTAGRCLAGRFEGVVGPAADLASLLLDAAPRLTVLATSQLPLGLDGESVYPLEPLPITESVQLFTCRAAEIRGPTRNGTWRSCGSSRPARTTPPSWRMRARTRRGTAAWPGNARPACCSVRPGR